MENNGQPLSQLLEQYVYRILEINIDQVDSDTQARLIQLYSNIYDQLCADSPDSASVPQLATQWSNEQREDIKIFRDLFVSYQCKIKAISVSIQQMNELINRASRGQLRSSDQLQLINHYQSIRKGFVVSLEKAQLFCEVELFKRLGQAG